MTKQERMEREFLLNSIREEIQLAYAMFKHENLLQAPKCKRLRTCQAYVYFDTNYIYLRSYNTVVAFIDRHTHILYDVLRLVYGYTSTSCQHICKFKSDYRSFWNRILTYK